MGLHRLLIANRGEIACRIMATCRALGIETVAVYSDADRFARHVREADQAVRLGPAPAAESYLDTGAILAAARETGADAVHPGYGFLSENAGFAEAVIDAGLVWVGPAQETIAAMGLKDEAKQIAEEAGVPVLPGYRGTDQSLKALKAAAKEIGYPLLIKAIAGGGGRGIRLVREVGELAEALESAVREAENAFGDGRVMLEKLVEQPRHIEVQVFGDDAGHVIHLFERDCSLQRRRQKVVEEAPAPGMPDDVRAAMTGAAVRLAEKVGYRNAGTVEFIVDGSRPLATDSFWFLEMNTRLQVEHPVTEAVTGLDLVALQLRVAAGEPLGLGQDDITLTGHAIEARICAEDPSDGFRPGAGRLEVFGPLEAPGSETLRWDTGFAAGDRVPPDYDSMLAKLIVHGASRDEAIDAMAGILSHTQIIGVPGNVGFLGRCIVSEDFGEGAHHVNWITEQGTALTRPLEESREAALAAVADVVLRAAPAEATGAPWDIRDGFRLNLPSCRHVRLSVDGAVVDAPLEPPPDSPIPLVTDLSATRFAVTAAGDSFVIEVPDYEAEAEAVEGGDALKAPMPGKVIAVTVAPGDTVEKGQPLAVMEAMKMEHTLPAPRDGVVDSVGAEAGAQVAEGQVLVALVAG
ncbi:MAG: biotin carboxylase N-terminal domain-containing protein [Pseudomonadota bacterium]